MRNQVIVALGILTTALMGVAAAQSNIAGKWTGTATPSAGGPPNSWTMTLEQDGAQVTGSYADAAGGAGKVAGTVSGGQVEFSLQLTDGQEFTAKFVVNDDEWTMCTYGGASGGGTCAATRATD